MKPKQDRFTLDGLLSDPLTQLVMRSDNVTPKDVREAFAKAQAGLLRETITPNPEYSTVSSGQDWLA